MPPRCRWAAAAERARAAARRSAPRLLTPARPLQREGVVKLFVGQIPKTLEEDGVREGDCPPAARVQRRPRGVRRACLSRAASRACAVFQEYGEIVEIVILRDRRTGMHQARAQPCGCSPSRLPV